jgi:hypothetical protein
MVVRESKYESCGDKKNHTLTGNKRIDIAAAAQKHTGFYRA